MWKLILYSIIAHLVVLSLVFAAPLVTGNKTKQREMYRVSFVELTGSPKIKGDKTASVKKKSVVKKKRTAPKPKKAETVNKKEPSKVIKKATTVPKEEKKAEARKEPVIPDKVEKPAKVEPAKVEVEKKTAQQTVKPKVEKQAPVAKTKNKTEGGKQSSKTSPRNAETTAGLGPKGLGHISPDDVDFPYSYYMAILQRKISEHWNPGYGQLVRQRASKVVVYFKVLKNGTITNIKIEKSSGHSLIDESAIQAIVDSGPMPPLPHEYDGDELNIHFGFEYSQEG